MGKLNQIIAIEKDIKSRFLAKISELYKVLQKPTLFNGFSKEYRKLDEGDMDLPPESQKVTFFVKDILKEVEKASTEYMNITARKDWTNCKAQSTVTIGSHQLLENVPVSYLLFLEKRITDLRTFINTLPELAVEEDWTKDVNSGFFKSKTMRTHRTKKVTKPLVVVQATKEHPAQVQVISEDILAGHWDLTKVSGGIPKLEKEKLYERTEALLKALKEAREAANSQEEVVPPDVGKIIFEYLLGSGDSL